MENTAVRLASISICLVLVLYPKETVSVYQEEKIKFGLVHSWAEKLGADLWHFADYITRRKEVQERYKAAQLEIRDGKKLAEEMAAEIKKMMDLKISAVKRIMDAAENTAVSQPEDVNTTNFHYYNSKDLYEPGAMPEFEEDPSTGEKTYAPEAMELHLEPDPNFYNIPTNLSRSAVHVPTNVYDRSEEVIKAIKWSENLDDIFIYNYRMDPSLSWQYFGSSTGFMRQYPAIKWKQDPVDLFDCRTRGWYIGAANSPKDMIILVDNSGSMTGQRKDIARHVVNNILDTLGNNDFVNIYTFSQEIEEVVPCFKDVLVQANLANIREFKLGMEIMNTTEIANFSAALTKAFDILELYREERFGARCNQAIMLISDGVPFSYTNVFETYNWRDLPYMPVRVFTYLIGREVADVTEVKNMACNNQGFYVHLSTLAEVRDQVLNYIQVMARPLVLCRNEHPTVWTPVYADVADPKMTDWLWEVKECEEQKERFLAMRRNRAKFYSKHEQDRRFVMKQKRMQDQYGTLQSYQLMTSVSMPVYDRRENASRVANLLGVAGTDVPIQDIRRLMTPHMLGVNGYAFVVTNNGYILTHPDLRPVFQGILKPSYNSVDMAEVELMDDDRGPRDFDPSLLAFRDAVINQSAGQKWLQVKYHLDDMKRVSRIRRQYYWTGIKNTPFTLVVSVPEPYGLHRLQIRSEDEIHRVHAKGTQAVNFFSGRHWRVHPEWLYCRQMGKSFPTPEAQLLSFLERMHLPGWKWPLNRTPSPPEHAAIYCDRNLIQSLVFDARVTEWYARNISSLNKDETGMEFLQRFGIYVVFIATHSGLTRWHDYYTDETRPEGHDFSEVNKRAIDEIWYRRAVEQHYIEQMSFVYSVPFYAGDNNDTLVTASHAVFHTEGSNKAPAAVVGFQFQLSALEAQFRNTTGCSDSTNCPHSCQSDDLECYVLDNNGYVIVGPPVPMSPLGSSPTGRFLGELPGGSAIMRRLVEDRVYRAIHIVDYQAVCFREKGSTNPASVLSTPLAHLRSLLHWFVGYAIWLLSQVPFIPTVQGYGFPYANEEVLYPETYGPPADLQNPQPQPGTVEPPSPGSTPFKPKKGEQYKEYTPEILINRTRPQPCDQEVTLYQLQQYPDKERSPYKVPAKGCDRPFVVQQIPASNLILLVVNVLCQMDNVEEPPMTTIPQEVYYNTTLCCHKIHYNDMSRRRPDSCINKHINESQIKDLCGQAPPTTTASTILIGLLCMISLLDTLSNRLMSSSKSSPPCRNTLRLCILAAPPTPSPLELPDSLWSVIRSWL